MRTLAALLARARAKGLHIGLVVDEAHIGLDKSTEFGKFAHWLAADYLLMATATPKDQRLTDFLAHAGYSAQEHFAVSRDEVVQARLNKQYIEAVVYSLGAGLAQVTDLRRTVLRQAWARNVRVGQLLQQVQGEEQVIGQTIAVGFQQHREVRLLGQPLPAFDQLYSLRQGAGPHVGLQCQVVAAVTRSDVECRCQVIHGTREYLAFDL